MNETRQYLEAGGQSSSLKELIKTAVAGSTARLDDSVALPPDAYVSSEFHQLEVERIFRREWLCVGHISQLQQVGDYFTVELLGEPMVIVRGKDRVRALSTVCRHRWAPVISGAGNARAFACPFHKWTYGLDGALIGAPLMEKAQGFDRKACRLPEFRSEVVEELGLVFVTFSDEVPSITARLESLIERVQKDRWSMKDQVVVHTVDQKNPYNWKVQVETYVECYHHIGGHEHTLQRLLPAAETSCEEDKGSWSVCNVRLTRSVESLSQAERQAMNGFAPGAKPGDTVGHIVLVYPFTLLTFMQGGCDIRILNPLGPGVTWSRILATRERAQVAEPGFSTWLAEFIATADIVNKEDNDINCMQQLGVASSRAQPGRFSHLEACAWYLAQYVRRAVGAS